MRTTTAFYLIATLALAGGCSTGEEAPDPTAYLDPHDADPAPGSPDAGDPLPDATVVDAADGPGDDAPAGEGGPDGETPAPGVPVELSCLAEPRAWSGGALLNEQQRSTAQVASAHARYACGPDDAIDLAGGEWVFHLRSELERDFSLFLSLQNRCGGMENQCPSWALRPRAVDLDLFVLSAPPGQAGGACVARSSSRSLDDERVTFRARAGQDYWVVVDGPAGGEGSFLLHGNCGTCLLPAATLGCNQTLLANTGTRALASVSRYYCQRAISTGEPRQIVDGQAGFEDAYRIGESDSYPHPRFPTNYTVRLSGLSQDLNLLVVDDSGSRCGDLACFDHGARPDTADEVVRFTGGVVPGGGTPPRVVVDGPQAGGAPYRLDVSCSPSCAPQRQLPCGSSENYLNTESAFPAQVDSWGSCAAGLDGPEVVYDLGQLRPGPHTALLTGLSADLDLIVLRSRVNSFECDPATPCVASSSTPGTADERLTFEADGTSTYVLAVDGRAGAQSYYNIKFFGPSCSPLSCEDRDVFLHLACFDPRDLRRNDDAHHATPPIDGYACAPEATGGQLIYTLALARDSTYTVVLDQLTADLDLVLLGCPSVLSPAAPPNLCSSHPGTQTETLTFESGDRTEARVAVVGKSGAVGSFRLQLQGPPCPGPVCGAVIFSPASCPARHVSSSGDTTRFVPPRRFERWPCTGDTPGPDHLIQVLPTRPTTFTARLDGPHPELELLVVEAADLAALCRGPSNACLAHRAPAGSAPAEVTFVGQPGREYYLVVDTLSEQAAPWELTIDATCP
jgi:hypothetical protein